MPTGASRRAFSETVLRSLRIFNQRKFEYEIRVVFVRRFLYVRMKTVVDSKPSNASVYGRADTVVVIELYRGSVTIRKKEGDNSLVA